MPVTAADFPEGTPNRIGLEYGCYVMFSIATFMFFMRVFVRTYIVRNVGLDDFFLLISWIVETIHIVFVKFEFDNGVGWHVKDLESLPNGENIMKNMLFWPWITQILYYFGLTAVKASIVALYLRLTVSPLQRKICWGMLVFVIVQGLSSTLIITVFTCDPIHEIWTNPSALNGPSCIDLPAFNIYNAALIIFQDLILALAPIAVIKNLNIDHKKKIALSLMFSLGALAIAGTITRQVTNSLVDYHRQDFTWHWAPVALSSIVESSLGITFVSVPAIVPLIKRWAGGPQPAEKCYKPPDVRSSIRSSSRMTFPTISRLLKLRPEEEFLYCVTEITAVNPSESKEDFEMASVGKSSHGRRESEGKILSTLNAILGNKDLEAQRSDVPSNGIGVITDIRIEPGYR